MVRREHDGVCFREPETMNPSMEEMNSAKVL